jgi:hypothetical protein
MTKQGGKSMKLRVYNDADGESHIDDVEIELKPLAVPRIEVHYIPGDHPRQCRLAPKAAIGD